MLDGELDMYGYLVLAVPVKDAVEGFVEMFTSFLQQVGWSLPSDIVLGSILRRIR